MSRAGRRDGHHAVTDTSLSELLKAKTSEGAQEMLARQQTNIKELRAEYGGVLRLPEGVSIDPTDYNYESPDEETTILTWGHLTPRRTASCG